MAKSLRIGMPLLSAGQAQKEITHNEALILLDAVVHACCAGPPINSAPQTPEQGLSYLVGSAPGGVWTGRPNAIACWSESGWRFIAPFDGLQLVDRANGRTWRYLAGQWSTGIINGSEVQIDGLRVLRNQQPPIANISGGNVVDSEARSALAQVLTALRNHGLIASA